MANGAGLQAIKPITAAIDPPQLHLAAVILACGDLRGNGSPLPGQVLLAQLGIQLDRCGDRLQRCLLWRGPSHLHNTASMF